MPATARTTATARFWAVAPPAPVRRVATTEYETFAGSVCTRIDQHVRYADGSRAINVIYVHWTEYRSWDA